VAAQGPLLRAVEEKRFRGDLYARLNGFTLHVPPLRERVEEVPSLFRKLVERHGPARKVDALLVERLCTHGWPFNARELTLLVRRLLALHPDARVLEAAMWPEEAPAAAPAAAPEEAPPRGQELDTRAFLAALRDNRGNVKQTAAALGISRGRAYRFMQTIDELDLKVIRREPRS